MHFTVNENVYCVSTCFVSKVSHVAAAGPKIDVGVTDTIGRTWQCSTIQCDFNMPARFGLQYASADGGAAATPIMLHRAIFGSLERFIGLLIEHYAGDFPLWLAPTQLRLLPISAGGSGPRCNFCCAV